VTYKTGQMSVCVSVSPFFQTVKLQNLWVDIDETWCVYYTGPGTNLLRSEILSFGPCTVWGRPKLKPFGRDDPTRLWWSYYVTLWQRV